jgi:hypothetical protein
MKMRPFQSQTGFSCFLGIFRIFQEFLDKTGHVQKNKYILGKKQHILGKKQHILGKKQHILGKKQHILGKKQHILGKNSIF